MYHFQEEALRARACTVRHFSFPCHLGGARSTCWGGVSFNLCLCLTLRCKFPVRHFFTQHAGWAKNTFSWHSPTEYWGCLWLQKNLTYADWYMAYMIPWTSASLPCKKLVHICTSGMVLNFCFCWRKEYNFHIWLRSWGQYRHIFIDTVGKDISNFFK